MSKIYGKKGSASFELVIQVRDSNGAPTGKVKTIQTDSQNELSTFWDRNSGVPKRKKSNKKKATKTSKIVQDIESLTKLEKDWDGFSGVPVNMHVAANATQAVLAISDVMKFAPRVIAGNNGSLTLEFLSKNNNRELSIRFLDQFTVEYEYYDPANDLIETKSIGLNELNKLRDVVILLTKK